MASPRNRTPVDNVNASDLPPPRKSKAMKPVSPPLSSTRLNRLIYLLVIISTLLAAYYSYRLVQWKSDVGGWWNLAVGKRPPQLKTHPSPGFVGKKQATGKGARQNLEDRINGLAEALGMPSKDLASAIAVAVREYVPPASLSSISAQETGPAVEALIKGVRNEESGRVQHEKSQNMDAPQGTGVVESFVGMDEP